MSDTETLKKVLLSDIFAELTDPEPRTIDDYNARVGAAVGRFAEEFGILKVEYVIEPPAEALLEFGLPKKALLFERRDGSAEVCGSPAVISLPFGGSGTVSFLIYTVAGVAFEAPVELRAAFRMFHHILNAILFDSLYSRLTSYDILTGLPNISAFLQFCEERINAGTIGDYTALSFNIRNFKSVHNALTYIEGNDLIKNYCRIVAGAITENEIVAHIGGDNFVAVILNENIDYFLDLIGNMVVRYRKDDSELMFSFGATVGALSLSSSADDPGEIMMHISAAYHSAREQRTLLSYYDKKSELDLLGQKTILSKFAQAMLGREFKVFYQPKVSVKDKTLCGAEALVRWTRPDGSMVMPGNFIPVLEKDGCITSLDFYVMEEVCKFQKRLLAEGFEPVKISINFSKRHLSDNKLVEEIVGLADLYNIPHEYIEVELTESEDFHNNIIMKDIVDELGSFGIKTSIDDFGTGYSSLGMLCTLSLDTLKIDRSFIPTSDSSGDKDNEKRLLMLKSVVGLSKNLGLTTVAEGVETPEQFELLEKMGCDIIQGYIFDKPLPEEEFVKRLKKRLYTVS